MEQVSRRKRWETWSGDDYNARGNWRNLLLNHGWTRARQRGGKEEWRRPGKKHGTSATWNHDGSGTFYVFSSNAAPLEPEQSYSPFALYARLGCGGDFSEATRRLAAEGYGNGIERGRTSRASNAGHSDGEQEDRKDRAERLPRIMVGGPLHTPTEAALKAMEQYNDPPKVFVRGGRLTRIGNDEDGNPVIEPLTLAALRGMRDRCAMWLRPPRTKDNPPTQTAPPLDVVKDLEALGSWPFPALTGITEIPVIRTSGEVNSSPGYDPESKLFYAPPPGFKAPDIPMEPTGKDAERAGSALAEVVCDFPFDCDASRANALAALITPVLRPIVNGLVPMALIDKPQAGTGATLLARLASIIATGRDGAMTTAPAIQGSS